MLLLKGALRGIGISVIRALAKSLGVCSLFCLLFFGALPPGAFCFWCLAVGVLRCCVFFVLWLSGLLAARVFAMSLCFVALLC